MNKKTYIAPQVEVTEMELVTMLASSPDPEVKVVDPNAEGGTGTDVLSNDRRGTWGNLWE